MNPITEETTARITVGGVVILVDERQVGKYVSYANSVQFFDEIQAIPGIQKIEGPLVNGVYAITCEIDNDQPVEAHVARLTKQIRRVWTGFTSQSDNTYHGWRREDSRV